MKTMKFKLTRLHWAKAAAMAYDRTVEKEVWQEKIQSSKTGVLHVATIGALGEIIFSELTGLQVDDAVYDRGTSAISLLGICGLQLRLVSGQEASLRCICFLMNQGDQTCLSCSGLIIDVTRLRCSVT